MTLVAMESFDVMRSAAELTASGLYVQTGAQVGRATAGGRPGSDGYGTLGQSSSLSRIIASPQPTMIAGMAFVVANSNSDILCFKDPTGVSNHVKIRHNQTTSAIDVYGAAGSLVGSSAPGSAPTGALWLYLECKVVVHDTTGSVEVRIDGVTILNLTNIDTKATGTTIGQVGWVYPNSTNALWIDDFYVCDNNGSVNNTFLGPCYVRVLRPTADVAAALVGSDGNSVNNYALVNEAVTDDLTYVQGGTNDTEDRYEFEDPAANLDVKGIAVHARLIRTASGPKSAALLTRSGGVNHLSSDQSILTMARWHEHIREQNPYTSTPWTSTTLGSASFGVRVRP